MYKNIEGILVTPRTTWFEDDNYKMSYETVNGEVYIHIVIDSFSKAILSDIKEKWLGFKLQLFSLGYENIYSYTKDMRIIKLVDMGELIGEAEGFKVVRWELN